MCVCSPTKHGDTWDEVCETTTQPQGDKQRGNTNINYRWFFLGFDLYELDPNNRWTLNKNGADTFKFIMKKDHREQSDSVII